MSLVELGTHVETALAIGGYHDSEQKLVVQLSNGTIKLRAKVGPLMTHGNDKTCLETTVDSGTYTLASGTGAYKGITGSGKLSLDFRAVGPIVNGKCSIPTTTAAQNIITLSGPASLP